MTSKPFATCAVYFGRPYLTIQGRGRSPAKRHLCLFLCLQTHFCHLEMAKPLEAGAFLNAFVRKILSHNGRRKRHQGISELGHGHVLRMKSKQGVTWYWNPPSAPLFGCVFKAMIKSSKRAIYAILKDADVTHEELLKTFTGVKSLMNSRPLIASSDDPNE